MDYSIYILYIVAASAPSLIWLFYYLLKDKHPEPKKAILNVFFSGAVVAAIVCLLTLLISKTIVVFFPNLLFNNIWFIVFKYFIIAALIEEVAKYLIAREFLTSSPEVDEPLDVMLYMVVAALGFAALENLLLVFTTVAPVGLKAITDFTLSRLIGATFLHTLASGTLGFFLATSFHYVKYSKRIFFAGLFIAVLMHGFYNFFIVSFIGWQQVLGQILVLLPLLFFTTWGFGRLRSYKAVSRINIEK